VCIDGAVVLKAGHLTKAGNCIEVTVPEVKSHEIVPYDFPLEIEYEDDTLMVVNKPSSLVVHPGAGNTSHTLLNALVHYTKHSEDELKNVPRFGIVHRLDKDTTGLIVVAKTSEAHTKLSAQFSERTVSRSYQALVMTTPRDRRAVQLEEEGVIDTFMGRHPTKRTLMAVVTSGGRRAITHWKRVEKMAYGCLLEVTLKTGRTHQIRVHMNYLGSPVYGDQVYGNFSSVPKNLILEAKQLGRQALHAYKLEFTHPSSGERMRFGSSIPEDFVNFLEACRSTTAS